MRRAAAAAGRLCRNQRGAAAVEFGLIGTMLIVMFCFWLELGLTTLMQTTLDNATRDAARQLRVGSITTSGAFETALCKDLSALMNCASIKYKVVSGSSFAGLSTAVTTTAGNVMSSTGFSPGASGDDVVVQVGYTRTVYLPLVEKFFGSGGAMLLVSTLAFQNEPLLMRRPLARFRRDRRGAIAVEFSFLLPVMIVILFGSFEVTRLVRASIRATNAAQTIADLIAQQDKVTTAQMSNFCKGGQIVMTPFPADSMLAAAASVSNSSAGFRSVDWQDATCGGGSTIATAVNLAAGYTPNPNDSVIVVRVVYAYAPLLKTVLSNTFSMTRYAYARPRNGTTVTHG